MAMATTTMATATAVGGVLPRAYDVTEEMGLEGGGDGCVAVCLAEAPDFVMLPGGLGGGKARVVEVATWPWACLSPECSGRGQPVLVTDQRVDGLALALAVVCCVACGQFLFVALPEPGDSGAAL